MISLRERGREGGREGGRGKRCGYLSYYLISTYLRVRSLVVMTTAPMIQASIPRRRMRGRRRGG